MNNPHTNSSELSYWQSLRATFYLVSPSETAFEHPSQVPNYVTAAIPHFFILVIIEMLILIAKGQRNLRINDKITSVGAGMYSEVLGLLGLKTFDFSMYAYIYTNYRLCELSWDSMWTWILMALAIDFIYYWFHRLAHEVNLLWNFHQTHHSSEDYTLTTALRQSAFQTYASSFFYLPLALLICPSAYLVHRQLNLLYQFWIHTELVDSLGPLEYVLNTPSHHRVHHGRNPYCIDKNYAAVLIIWDRMFGTFEAERKDEKVVYGLVHPVNTFDSMAIQIRHYIDFLKRFWETEGFRNKLSFLFNGPGWTPGSPRLGYPDSIPKIESPVQVYDPEVSNFVTSYVFTHYLLAVGLYNMAAQLHLVLPASMVVAACVFVLATITCFGYIFDKRSFAYTAEFLRCLICTVLLHLYQADIIKYMQINEQVFSGISTVFLLSAITWPFFIFRDGMKVFKEKTL